MSELTINPVFGALTRPAMACGVTFEYHMFNLALSMCFFIGLSPLYGLVFVPFHLFGWMVCRKDVHLFAIFYARFLLPQLPNVKIWRIRAYEPF